MTLRDLPSVDEVLRELDGAYPHHLAVAEIRRALDAARESIRDGRAPPAVAEQVRRSLEALARPSLRRVINATGVVLHTNLGRAPLGALQPIAGYSNLEYDLATGRRGKRDLHIAGLLERLLGHPGIAVNNNAAAVYLALHELAAGHEVIVSRGELIEIGDGFRIPDIMARSGAILKEVGTTNRTRIEDYRDAITGSTRLILRVHHSNFKVVGFTAQPALSELAALARERRIPLYEDLGSGCLVDLKPFGIEEPLARESLEAGVDLVSFSGDKLLGGPQAGIIAGRADLVARLRRNPMFRALRVDKLIYQALESTLRRVLLGDWSSVPALRMIAETAESIRERAESVARQAGAGVIEGQSVIGGGSTPAQSLPTWLIAVRTDSPDRVERALREHDPPVIARIENDRIVLDLRTVSKEEEADVIAALQTALA